VFVVEAAIARVLDGREGTELLPTVAQILGRPPASFAQWAAAHAALFTSADPQRRRRCDVTDLAERRFAMAVADRDVRPATSLFVTPGWPRALWVTGTVLLITMVVHIAALVITGGPVSGPVSLRKPATFAETGWLIAWSVALILPRLHTCAWQRHVIGAAVLLFTVGETAIIGLQAWRGVPSHYNFSTPLDAALMRGGAGGIAGVFLIGVIMLLIAALRIRDVTASVRLGVIAGIVVLLVACAVGFVMISNNSGVYQGSIGGGFARQTAAYLGPDAATVGPEYGLLRPGTQGGDLVAPHVIGIHGLVLLAVPAVLLTRSAMSRVRQLQVVALAVSSVATGLILLLAQALRQLPLDQLHPVALATLALCVLGLLAAYAVIAAALLKRAG
jgi:hypothetical protein